MKKNFKEVFKMKDKIEQVVAGLASVVELGCIIALAGIGLKRNKDCYDAECKLLEREMDLTYATVDIIKKDAEIVELKNRLKKCEEES
jgi:hypothetical protein